MTLLVKTNNQILRYMGYINTFRVVLLALVSLLICPQGLMGQSADYGSVGHTVIKRSAITGEVLGSGVLFKDQIIDPTEIKKLTLRYGPDTVATRESGEVYVVSRLMDFYYLDPNIILEDSVGNVVDHLPLVITLHAGLGDKNSSADEAMFWAQLGFSVIAPTVRSDRFGYDYCDCYRKSIYYAVQDVRAVIRLYSKIYDTSLLSNAVLQNSGLKPGQLNVIQKFRSSRTDGHAIFLSGKSYGGLISYHAATRVQQVEYEDYMWANQPYVLTGAEGSMNMGQSGLIDRIGLPIVANYPFPADRIRGFISRTAMVFDSVETIDYGGTANPVPGLFVHNTCDVIVPYGARDYVHNTGRCNADWVFPSGVVNTTTHQDGSSLISDHMHESGVYSEMLTFCGGGHDSNTCNEELINDASSEFVRRILTNAFTPGDKYERVYRYDLANYSNQCCKLGDQYGFMLKCSCEASNPFDVVDFPYIDCPIAPSCELVSMCDLQPPGMIEFDEDGMPTELSIKLVADGQAPYFEAHADESGSYVFRITTISGHELYTSTVNLNIGTNRIEMPAGMPKEELLIGRVAQSTPIKFQLVH